MIFFLGNMWMQIIKHFIWQLFTIADKGIPGPGNNQIAKASRGEAYMGGLTAPSTTIADKGIPGPGNNQIAKAS